MIQIVKQGLEQLSAHAVCDNVNMPMGGFSHARW